MSYRTTADDCIGDNPPIRNAGRRRGLSQSSSGHKGRRAKAEERGTRSKSQVDLLHTIRPEFLLTPLRPSAALPASTSTPASLRRRSSSSPQFPRPRSGSSSSATVIPEPVYANCREMTNEATSDEERDSDEDDTLYVSRSTRSHIGQAGIRSRKHAAVSRWLEAETNTGVHGQAFAGETETELEDETSGKPSTSMPDQTPLIPFVVEFLVPYLFEFSRLLSVVPAVFGTLYNIHNIIHPPSPVQNTSIDFAISALWAILTGFQCLALTTGLLTRWKVYYTTSSTLIRLVALQAICWPATHLTLTFFDHAKRPVACWAIIGSSTCFSRSVQLWVTSNILVGRTARGEGRVGPRRWNWAEVGVKSVLPAGFLYFLTTWALLLRGELFRCF